MPRCVSQCTDYRTDTIDNAWTDIRGYFGPTTVGVGSSVYSQDITEWTAWATANGKVLTDASFFGKWLIWRITKRTTNYGNLPTRVGDHTGICNVHCPYDSNASIIRVRLLLGLSDTDPLPSRVDHGTYYMKVANRLSLWGTECTFDGCLYKVAKGKPYFYA
jgi:hypothetical protein